MADQFTFPQDFATGLTEDVDWVDAGAFAFLVDHPNLRDYVVTGFEFDPDWAADIVRVGEGRLFAFEPETHTNDHRDNDGPDSRTLEGSIFAHQRGVSGDLTLNEDARNYVFLDIKQDNVDESEYVVNTTQTTPAEPYLYLGWVDTEIEEYQETKRNPVTTSRRARVTGPTDIYS